MATMEEREQLVVEAEALATADERRLRQSIGEARRRGMAAVEALGRIETELVGADAGHRDDEEVIPGLLKRVRGTFLPPLDLEGHQERELSVREDAVRARAWVNSALDNDLKHFFAGLDHVEIVIRECSEELRALRNGRPLASEPAPAPEGEAEAEAELEAESAPDDPDAATAEARRRSARLHLETEISLHGNSNFFRGFSENISDGGIFIATDRPVAIGTEVDLAFRLPDGVEIRGRGIVRWIRAVDSAESGGAAGVGVSFETLVGAAKSAIEDFIASRDPIFYPV